jgi:hypothetical protein
VVSSSRGCHVMICAHWDVRHASCDRQLERAALHTAPQACRGRGVSGVGNGRQSVCVCGGGDRGRGAGEERRAGSQQQPWLCIQEYRRHVAEVQRYVQSAAGRACQIKQGGGGGHVDEQSVRSVSLSSCGACQLSQ